MYNNVYKIFADVQHIYYYGANGEKDPKSLVRDTSHI